MTNTAAACDDVSADLSALIDAELTPEREAAVRAHLADCPSCRERLERLCDVDLELANAPVSAAPADLWERLSSRLADEAAAAPPAAADRRRRESRPGRSAPRRRSGLPRPVWSAAIAAAAAAALYLAVMRGEPGPPLEPDPTAPEIAETAPVPAPRSPEPSEPSPAPRAVAERTPPPAVVDPLDGASDEELVVVLELETIEDFDLIANLDLLESWLDLEGGASG